LYFTIVHIKQKKKIKQQLFLSDNLQTKINTMKGELTRLLVISKAEDMKLQYHEYNRKFEEILSDFSEINHDVVTLVKEKSIYKNGSFKKGYTVLYEDLEDVEANLDQLSVEISKINSFERSNQEILIGIKEEFKKTRNNFAFHQEELRNFEDNFLNKVSLISTQFSELEEIMKQGNHKVARNQINIIIDEVEILMINVNFYIFSFTTLEKEIKPVLLAVKDLLAKLLDGGGKAATLHFHELSTAIEEEIRIIFKEIIDIQFDSEIDEIIEKKFRDMIEAQTIEVTSLLDDVNTEFEFIEIIQEIILKNDSLISNNLELIADSIIEEKEIKDKYRIENVSELTELDKTVNQFNEFLKDYHEIKALFENGEKNFSDLVEDFKKAQAYVIRTNNKIILAGKKLQSIRVDEINAIKSLDFFRLRLDQMELYLSYHNFNHKISNEVKEYFTEISLKIDNMEHELDEESLDILRITRLNESILELIKKQEADIKKEIEVHNVAIEFILYMNCRNFKTNTKEIQNYTQQIARLLRDAKYEKIIIDLDLFFRSTKNGFQIFSALKKSQRILTIDEFLE